MSASRAETKREILTAKRRAVGEASELSPPDIEVVSLGGS